MSSQQPERRSGSGGGVALGVALSLLVPAAFFVTWGFGFGAAAVAAVVGLVLVFRDDPFERGVGSGLLAGVATMTLFFGACYAIVSSITSSI